MGDQGRVLLDARPDLFSFSNIVNSAAYWQRAIDTLLIQRDYWFERRRTSTSAQEIVRASKEISRCETLIMKIETLYLTPLCMTGFCEAASELEEESLALEHARLKKALAGAISRVS